MAIASKHTYKLINTENDLCSDEPYDIYASDNENVLCAVFDYFKASDDMYYLGIAKTYRIIENPCSLYELDGFSTIIAYDFRYLPLIYKIFETYKHLVQVKKIS